MLFSENYAFVLKQAATKLENALFQIPLASIGMNADIKSEMFELFHLQDNARFEEITVLVHQTKVLKEELENAFFSNGKETQELKQSIQGLIEEHKASKKEFRDELSTLKKDALETNKNKEKQLEFELNEIISATTELLRCMVQPQT